jgi:hypothetical protein
VQVGLYDTFIGVFAHAFACTGYPFLTKGLGSLFHVAIGFLQGFFAVHDPGACLIAQDPDQLNIHRQLIAPK